MRLPKSSCDRCLPLPTFLLTSFVFPLIFVGCSGSPGSTPAPPRSPAAYRVPNSRAGAERCAACHAGKVKSWSQTGMARSLGPVRLGELDHFAMVDDGESGYLYQFARSPDVREHVLAETHVDYPGHAFGTSVVLGIGSGELDRSYAVRYGASLRFAALEVLPTEQGRHSALAPGHMMRSGVRFDTPITNACLTCHTDALPKQRFPLDLEPGPEWHARGISCAACHGRSEEHADWQESDIQTGDPIVRHERLSRIQQLSICATCHLQGDARVRTRPRSTKMWLPGLEFMQARAVFVAEDSSAQVGFVSHVERLVKSKCFRRSSMTCSNCHDPHRSLHQEPERQRVRSACNQCHAQATEDFDGTESSYDHGPGCAREPKDSDAAKDCVSCHMPLAGTFDVARVQIHDHFIRRDGSDAPGPSSPQQLRVLETREGRLKRFEWLEASVPKTEEEDPGLLMMAYASAKLDNQALEYLDQKPRPETRELEDYQHLRGLLLEHAGRFEEAELAYRHALSINPKASASSINLALVLASLGRPREAYDLLTKALEHHPQAEGALRNRALIAMQLGKPQLFASDLQKAFAILPSANLAISLSQYYASKGDALAQSRWRKLANELDPTRGR